jgi:hypothetical protein
MVKLVQRETSRGGGGLGLPYPWLEIRDGVCRTRDFRISKEFLNAGFESLKKGSGMSFRATVY